MTTDEKLMALKALTPTHLEMRYPGDWYVSAYARSVEYGQFMRYSYGNGSTPESAIDDDWEIISAAPIVVIGGISERRVHWNGYMWEDLK